MKAKFILVILALVLYSCARTLPDEELTMIRTPYSGTDIRLNGCFVSVPNELKYCEYNFFYGNGVFFGFGDLPNIEQITQIGEIDFKQKYKGYWGLYQVENNIIKVQTWRHEDVSTRFIVQKLNYKIINDTTLTVDLLNDGDVRYYHYKKFSPKPDSTNVFIK